MDLYAFFIPYWFIFNPELLLAKGAIANLCVILIAAVGVVSLSAMTQGGLRRLNSMERIVAVLITFALLLVDFKWRMLGLAVFVVMLIHQKIKVGKTATEANGKLASVGD